MSSLFVANDEFHKLLLKNILGKAEKNLGPAMPTSQNQSLNEKVLKCVTSHIGITEIFLKTHIQ